MMAYKNQHVLAVIQHGKIVPEKDGGVTLPYGSEYQIRLKNKSRQKSIADVYLDGAIAVKGIIIDEDGTVDLERYIRPGLDSLTGGPRFKLARLDHPGVADAGDSQNGLLEVRFYKELETPRIEKEYISYPCYPPAYSTWPIPYTRWPSHPWISSTTTNMSYDSLGSSNEACQYDLSMEKDRTLHTKGIKPQSIIRSKTMDGPAATVQGSHSGQRVQNVSIQVDTTKFETLSLKLFGVTRITRLEKCPKCNHKRKNNERFCPSCGEILVLEG
jgi:hypothetical protein